MEDIKGLVIENKRNLIRFCIIIAGLAVMLIGILPWKLPAFPVFIFVILEGALAVCLQKIPVWLHGAVLIAQLIAGLLFGNGIFVLLCAAYYVASILILSIGNK